MAEGLGKYIYLNKFPTSGGGGPILELWEVCSTSLLQYTQVYSDQEWWYQLGSYLWVK